MWKFIRGKGQQPLAERQKLQKELYAYKKVIAVIKRAQISNLVH